MSKSQKFRGCNRTLLLPLCSGQIGLDYLELQEGLLFPFPVFYALRFEQLSTKEVERSGQDSTVTSLPNL